MAGDLARRTAERNQVQQQQSSDDEPSLKQLIERMRPEMARALPKHLDADRLTRIAITLVAQTPALADCTSSSFLGALMTSAQLGLEPGPLGEAYLVPYGGKVTFIPGYRGLIKLAWQSGKLKTIAAHVVRDNDEFDFAYGLEPTLTHRPQLRGDRGKVFAVYAAATFIDGGSAFVVMSIDEVEEIRKRSKAGQKGPWVTDWDAMAKKTAVRQLARWLPMSTDLTRAAAMDGTQRDEAVKGVATLDEAQTIQVDAFDGAANNPALAGLPDPDTDPDGWHREQHPQAGPDGNVVRSDVAADCNWCAVADEGAAADARNGR